MWESGKKGVEGFVGTLRLASKVAPRSAVEDRDRAGIWPRPSRPSEFPGSRLPIQLLRVIHALELRCPTVALHSYRVTYG